jgi:HEPN domain-containing protein
LLELCGEYCGWAGDLQDAVSLTLYSITTRYPGEDEEVTKAEATQAIEIARQVRDRVRIELKKVGVDLPE